MQTGKFTLTIHHIGARGETQAFPRIEVFETDIVNVLYEADAACLDELKALNTGRKANVLIVPRCISGKTGPREFFHSEHGYCSSLLPGSSAYPNLYVSANWLDYDYIVQEAVSAKEITQFGTITLDDLATSDSIPLPDFLSLDTQGSELEILSGSPRALSTTLGLVTEVEFIPLYHDQPLFGEISHFLQNAGFVLCRQFPPLNGSPYRAPLGLRGEQIPVTADFLFLRDPDTLLAQPLNDSDKRLALKKLAFIAVVFGYFEHALWALEVARKITPDSLSNTQKEATWLRFISEFENISHAFPQLYPDGYSGRHQHGLPEANKQLFIDIASGKITQIKEGISALSLLFRRHGLDNLAQTLQRKFESDAHTLGIAGNEPTGEAPPQVTTAVAARELSHEPRYGAVWSAPADTLADIFKSCSNTGDALRQALDKGYFSQYTSFRKRGYIEAVADWQLELLAPWLGLELDQLPASLDELSSVPGHLLVERHGRTLSPDLLRNLWYAQFLCHGDAPLLPQSARNILEIGSGYGNLARCLKTLRPGATLWLLDLSESLACAAAYLEQAFPDRRIIRLDSPEQALPCDGEADFVLVPVARAEQLAGRHFDLALNLWSFGEMPNTWIRRWFDLIQVQCQVDRIYLLNAFMAPVTSESTESCLQGDWLLNLDESWQVSHYEIDPPIHRCPHVRNFYTGIAIFATHVQDLETLNAIRLNAAMEVNKVLFEDWAQFVIAGDLTDLARPESNLDDDDPYEIQSTSLSYKNWKTKTLLSITEYIGLPHIESGLESPLFRLWNDFRCNCNPNSAILLASYLAMIGKAIPGQRCVKEIVFLLGRIPAASLHNEYAPLQNSFNTEIRAVANQLYIQACALDREGLGIKAERAYRAVIKADRGHPSALYSLAYLLKLSGRIAEAVDMARAALENQPGDHTRTLLAQCLALFAFEQAQFGNLDTLPPLAAELSRLGATEEAEAISDFCNEALAQHTD